MFIRTFFLLFSSFFLHSFSLAAQVSDTSKAVIYADSLIEESRALSTKQELIAANEIIKLVEVIIEKNNLEDLTVTGNYHFEKGRISYFGRDFISAKTHYDKALEIFIKTLGVKSLKASLCYMNLGVILLQEGKYEEAIIDLERAKKVTQEILKPQDPGLFLPMLNLGSVYLFIGDYEAAEKMFLEIKQISIENDQKGKTYLKSLINLGTVYFNLSNFKKAEELSLEVISVMKDDRSSLSDYSDALGNYAGILTETKRYDEALVILDTVLILQEKIYGKKHSKYANALSNKGMVKMRMKKMKEAKRLYFYARRIFEEELQDTLAPNYITNLNNLANLYAETGQLEEAEQLFLIVKKKRKIALGSTHSDYIDTYYSLGELYALKKDFEKAIPHFDTASIGYENLILKSVNHLSEVELEEYIKSYSDINEKNLSIAHDLLHLIFLEENDKIASGAIKIDDKMLERIRELLKNTYDNALFYKGFLQNSMNQIRNFPQKDTSYIKVFNELKYSERILLRLSTQQETEEDSEMIKEISESVNALEKELAKIWSGYADAKRVIRHTEIKSKLKNTEVAIEFVNFRYYNTDSSYYAALIQRPEDEQPIYVALCNADDLELFIKTKLKESYNNLYAYKKEKSLYDLIWRPIEAYTEDATVIHYSPAGLLHQINLSIIGTPDRKILCERFQLNALLSTRTLSTDDNNFDFQNLKNAALFGNIDYSDSKNLQEKKSDSTPIPWHSLGTDDETKVIAEILDKKGIHSKTYFGKQASEDTFKKECINDNAPELFHFSGHGYYFDQFNSEIQNVFSQSRNSLIRSGLVLANANQVWTTGISPEGKQDGVLTALEISKTDLSNTRLATLSACQTGLGDIEGLEGVYGLQRAFRIAGAERILMSLWEVPTDATTIWMEKFYSFLLEDKKSPEIAYRDTLIYMKNEQKNIGIKDWGGFILTK